MGIRNARRKWWSIASAIAIGGCLVMFRASGLDAQAGTQGQWKTLPGLMPINPVHLALMNTGKVLVVAGSGNVAAETNFQAGVWDPDTGSVTTQPLAWDMFCNGMVVLSDGRVLVNGGTLQYDPFHGQSRSDVFDPATNVFTEVQTMAHGRWYPTVTTLGDGSVMTFSGLNETGGTNTAVEIYTPGSGWSPEYPAGWTPPLYPRMHLLPNGNVFYSGSGTGSRTFNVSTRTWSAVTATTKYSGTRTYGTSVLLPLTPANGYRPKVIIMGGGNPATNTTELIDLGAPTPQWQFGPAMSQPRIEMNATMLPNGKVLAVGGSLNNEDTTTASLNADLYDPATNTFSSAGANAYARLYHSGALLLPDATVLFVGGNPQRGSYEQRMEVYSPAYLFNADGTAATRPAISSVTPGAFHYGDSFQVQTPDAANISSVVLVRPGAPTHAFDMEQRLVGLSYTAAAGVLNVTAPPNSNIAPPGYYMLFVVNSAGVPSVATFIRLTTAPPNQPPSATITSPAADVTVNPGGSVTFAGAGTDADGTIASYSWTFPGGNPASSSVAVPGDVVYSTPGSYTATFNVTDNNGATSASATRTVKVSSFSLSATPSSQTVAPGNGAGYTVTVTPASGFTGTVGLSVTGLPSGATAAFSPASITSSGSSTLNVTTAAGTPPGTYSVTISGTSGSLTRNVNVTLFVQSGDFSIAATPANVTINPGGIAHYTVTVTGSAGFSGVVSLSVSNAPARATTVFKPASITTSGTSVLTVDTQKTVQKGTRAMTVTGTAGSLVHSVNVTLTIK